jgi:hypothetical protein
MRERGLHSFNDLITTRQFDEIVACTNLRYPYFRLFKDGRLVPPEDTMTSRQVGPDRDDGLADLNVLYDHFCEGGTIVLQAMERWWPPLSDFCRDLACDLRFPTQAYVYLAPAGAHGSPPHYDTHEVFALQVEGSKLWKIWGNPKPLPMRVHANDYDAESVQEYARTNDPLCEVLLEPGNALYIPRGYVHAAQAGPKGSVHVSISVMVYRWIDVIQSELEVALRKCSCDVLYREALPFGRRPGDALEQSAKERFVALTESLIAYLDLRHGLAILDAELVDYIKPSFRHRLKEVMAPDAITLETVIELRPYILWRLGEEENLVVLRFGGCRASFPRHYGPALQFLAAGAACRVGDIPGALDAAERAALARTLIAQGFCRASPS